jgi:ABC-2 type transport system permease protein
MKKFIAAAKKETIILLRDKIGLSILFIMPIVLIVVMTLIQDSAFHAISEKGVPLVFVNEDQNDLGNTIHDGLKTSTLCQLSDNIDGKPATKESARKAVSEGKYLIGIVIPKGATTKVKESVSDLVGQTMGLSDENAKSTMDSLEIIMFVDPVAKNSIVTTVMSSLREFISGVKTKIMFEAFSEQIAEIIPDKQNKPTNAYEKTQIIKYKQIYASNLVDEVVPNAVQHNVPAWTIFGMFFIVVSVVSNIMKEKKEGSAFRLYTMPTSYFLQMASKVIVYVVICVLQFITMMLVGIYILPFFGLDSLDLGDSIGSVLVLGTATGFAATGFGIFVGTLAQSEQQGAILGSLSVLLLSALGGIWVPAYVMPDTMRQISAFSPMNWSLDGFYLLFFRGAGFMGVLPAILKLLLFFGITLLISLWLHKKRRSI